uniref:Ig-like domain-containing protein n=1 Tax=Nothobranchius kuhntae TaxID=321403 RepID=A0A1A8HWU6_NOTKU
MWIRTVSWLTVMLMVLSAAEDVKNTLSGVVGGSITLLDPVPERGFLSHNKPIIASVSPFGLDVYLNRVQWDRNSGLFTITDLQKTDSGVYTIESKTGRVFIKSYNLTVYDSAPTPTVKRLAGTSDGCRLLCSVEKRTSLLWYKDEEILNQNHSVFSLLITVQNQDQNSSYRCVSANPADSKTHHLNVRESCALNLGQTGIGNPRIRLFTYAFPILCIVMIVLVGCLIKQRFLRKKRQESLKAEDVQYTTVQIRYDRRNQGGNPPEPSGGAENAALTSIYTMLEHHSPNQTTPDVHV